MHGWCQILLLLLFVNYDYDYDYYYYIIVRKGDRTCSSSSTSSSSSRSSSSIVVEKTTTRFGNNFVHSCRSTLYRRQQQQKNASMIRSRTRKWPTSSTVSASNISKLTNDGLACVGLRTFLFSFHPSHRIASRFLPNLLAVLQDTRGPQFLFWFGLVWFV